MAKNLEIKARISDIGYCINKAESLSGARGQTIIQEDIFFNCPRGRLKLRVFSNASGELIFYCRPGAAGPEISEYSISSTQEPHGLGALLEKSFGVYGKVKKIRQLYIIGRTRVHIDTVEGLGRFLELEVVLGDGEDIAAARIEMHGLMSAFKIEKTDLLTRAYVDMIRENP